MARFSAEIVNILTILQYTLDFCESQVCKRLRRCQRTGMFRRVRGHLDSLSFLVLSSPRSPSLKSRAPRPKPRMSSGIRFAPKSSKSMTTRSTISTQPTRIVCLVRLDNFICLIYLFPDMISSKMLMPRPDLGRGNNIQQCTLMHAARNFLTLWLRRGSHEIEHSYRGRNCTNRSVARVHSRS